MSSIRNSRWASLIKDTELKWKLVYCHDKSQDEEMDIFMVREFSYLPVHLDLHKDKEGCLEKLGDLNFIQRVCWIRCFSC